MATTDVNSVLSSSEQSGAALVAIVGGLLGSRFVALDADQKAARRRLVEARSLLAATREAELDGPGSWNVVQLEAEERAAERDVARTRQPAGFGLALQVLGYIAATSILLPLALMVWDPGHLGPGWRVAVGAAFASGVLLLFRYLFVYAAVLGARSDLTTMPGTVVGLVVPHRRR